MRLGDRARSITAPQKRRASRPHRQRYDDVTSCRLGNSRCLRRPRLCDARTQAVTLSHCQPVPFCAGAGADGRSNYAKMPIERRARAVD